MIVPFMDGNTGTAVYINPAYVVTLRPTLSILIESASSSSRTGRPYGCSASTARSPTSSPDSRRPSGPTTA